MPIFYSCFYKHLKELTRGFKNVHSGRVTGQKFRPGSISGTPPQSPFQRQFSIWSCYDSHSSTICCRMEPLGDNWQGVCTYRADVLACSQLTVSKRWVEPITATLMKSNQWPDHFLIQKLTRRGHVKEQCSIYGPLFDDTSTEMTVGSECNDNYVHSTLYTCSIHHRPRLHCSVGVQTFCKYRTGSADTEGPRNAPCRHELSAK